MVNLTHCPSCNKPLGESYSFCYPLNELNNLFITTCKKHQGGCGRTIHGISNTHSKERFIDLNIQNEKILTQKEAYSLLDKIIKIEKLTNNVSLF